jgi:hypothetical protein
MPPERYLAIKESLMKQGKSEEEAKRIGAATYNKTRKPGEEPLTRNYDAVHKASGRMKGKKK